MQNNIHINIKGPFEEKRVLYQKIYNRLKETGSIEVLEENGFIYKTNIEDVETYLAKILSDIASTVKSSTKETINVFIDIEKIIKQKYGWICKQRFLTIQLTSHNDHLITISDQISESAIYDDPNQQISYIRYKLNNHKLISYDTLIDGYLFLKQRLPENNLKCLLKIMSKRREDPYTFYFYKNIEEAILDLLEEKTNERT